MKSLSNTLKNNIWYIVVGATLVTAGVGIAITKPWISENITDDTPLDVGYWVEDFYQAFNTELSYSVRIENEDQASGRRWKETKDEIIKMIKEYHCDFTNKASDESSCGQTANVIALNKTMTKIEITQKLYDVLKYGQEMNTTTKGYFSIAQGKIISLWKDGLISKGDSATETDLNNVIAQVESKKNTKPDTETIELTESNGKYFAQRKDDVNIDLGGIGKAVVADKMKSILSDAGYTRYYVNSGGSSWIVNGQYNTKSGWIGVYNPSWKEQNDCYELTCNGEYYKAIEVDPTDSALGTSGDYALNNHVFVNGVRYQHIVNPHTGYPSTGIGSTTIIGATAAHSDVWSTALLAMGDVEAEIFFSQNPDIIGTYYNRNTRTTHLTQKAQDSKKVKVCTSETDCPR